MSSVNSKYNQNDLSFDKTKVDFEVLLETARIAVKYTYHDAQRQMGLLENVLSDPKTTRTNSNAKAYAENLSVASRELAIALDMLHVLEESLTRSEFVVVNKPEIKED